jgi:hypothetical protein
VEQQLLQLTFLPAGILKTSVLNDTVIRNAFDSVFTLFPHVCPMIALLNEGKKPFVVNYAIVDNGMDLENTDISYTRGARSEELLPRSQRMTWMVGYANICSLLKDVNLKQRCLNAAIPFIHGNEVIFYHEVVSHYYPEADWTQLLDLWLALDDRHRSALLTEFQAQHPELNASSPIILTLKHRSQRWREQLKEIIRRPRSLFQKLKFSFLK